MNFYHYSSLDKLRRMTSPYQQEQAANLKPRRQFITLESVPKDLPPKASEGAIFGLLDPMDSAWCSATYHKNEPLLETVLSDISDDKLALLEIVVYPSDDIHIADHGPHLRKDYDGRKSENKKVVWEVKREYWNSLVPFANYAAQNCPYALPEVICFSPIPLERIHVLDIFDQDKLINDIRAKGGFPLHPIRPKIDGNAQARLAAELFGFKQN